MSNDIQLGTFPPIDGGGHSTTHEEAAAGDITTRLGVPANDNASLDSKTLLKLLSCGFSFFYAGCNDGALGTLIPFLLTSYNINTSFIAIIYSVTFLGWLVAAFTNSHLTHALRLSMGATLALGAILQLLANVLRVWRPPFPLFCISFFFTYLGMGYQDSHSNTFTASVKSAHRWLGFIHASYAAGTATGPLLAAVIANHSRWNYFYLYTIGVGLVNLCLVLVAFHEPLLRASPSPAEAEVETARGNRKAVEDLKRTLQLRSVWLLSIFYFFFLGSVFTLSGKPTCALVRDKATDKRRLGGRVPSSGPSWRVVPDGICPYWLLRRRSSWANSASRTYISLRRAENGGFVYNYLSRAPTSLLA